MLNRAASQARLAQLAGNNGAPLDLVVRHKDSEMRFIWSYVTREDKCENMVC